MSISSIANAKNDATLANIKSTLVECLQDEETYKHNKMLIILLNDANENYHTQFLNCGMKC